jgi:hypothetical protein
MCTLAEYYNPLPYRCHVLYRHVLGIDKRRRRQQCKDFGIVEAERFLKKRKAGP